MNDGSGHAAGDLLLQLAAKALQGAARETDLVARLGGDEFGILAIECDRQGAETLLLRARAALHEAGVPASVGMALRNPASGLQAAWDSADLAMYAVKRQQGGGAKDSAEPRPPA